VLRGGIIGASVHLVDACVGFVVLVGFAGDSWVDGEADVFNPAFDVTPAELITAAVTEHGRYQPRDGQR
jgi:translation initiation factor 2B subunit (eIF-2B alpha/beta/delta family)